MLTVLGILFILYAAGLALAIASRAKDPVVRRSLHLVILIPALALPLARTVGVLPTLLAVVVGAGAYLFVSAARDAKPAPAQDEAGAAPEPRSPLAGFARRLSRAGRQA